MLTTNADHEVDAATAGAHAHDHSHSGGTRRSTMALHEHHHLHRGGVEADGRLNGHTHVAVHVRHPWELSDES